MGVIVVSDHGPNLSSGDRLNGWKMIAAHFGRDRTTVIRWARERGLPVHRLPGGKTATVFALRQELDRWAGLPLPKQAPAPAPGPHQLLQLPVLWTGGTGVAYSIEVRAAYPVAFRML